VERRKLTKKVLLLGDASVGKTSLIRKFVLDEFSDDYLATLGTKVTKETLFVERPGELIELAMMIWDVLGQKGFSGVLATALRGAEGVFLVADITRRETFESLEKHWLGEVLRGFDRIPVVLLVNKADRTDRAVSEAEIAAFTRRLSSPGFITSAKSGLNVQNAFAAMGERLLAIQAVPGSAPVKFTFSMTPAVVLDSIMTEFRETIGNQEAGMNFVRDAAQKADLDVRNPEVAALAAFAKELADLGRGLIDEEELGVAVKRWTALVDRLAKAGSGPARPMVRGS